MTFTPLTIKMITGHGPRQWWAGTSLEADTRAQLFGPWENEPSWTVWTQGRAGGTSWNTYATKEEAQEHIRSFFGRPVEYAPRT